MKHRIAALAGLALSLLLSAGVGCSQQKTQISPAQQEKLSALKELRDSGVITAQEYAAKVQSLQAAAPAASAAHTEPVHFARITSGTKRVEVPDPQYNMTAVSLEIPADWKFAGTIARPEGCHANGPSLKYTAQSPDGLITVVSLPGVSWTWQNSEAAKKYPPACAPIDINSSASFLVNIALPNIHPDAKDVKVVSVQPLDAEGQAGLKDQLAKELEQNASMGNFKQVNPKVTLDGAMLRLQYERDGHPVEEMMSSIVHCNEETMAALFTNPAYQRRTCFSRGTWITRAPQGHLDEVLAKTKFGKTLQANPNWQSRIFNDQLAAAKQAMDANNAQAAANLQHFKEQGDARLAAGRAFQQRQADSFNAAMTADRQRQAAIDASAHATALYSLDRQEFRNPATGQIIEASNQYNHQWISSDGSTLIQTNSNADPNGAVYPVSQSWSELVVK